MADVKQIASWFFASVASCIVIISCYALCISFLPINVTTIETNKSVALSNGSLRHPKNLQMDKIQPTTPSPSYNPRIFNFTKIGEKDLIEKCKDDLQTYYIYLFVKLFICGIATLIPILMFKISYIERMETCYFLICVVLVSIVLLTYDVLAFNFFQTEHMSIHDKWTCSKDISLFVPHATYLNNLIYLTAYFHVVPFVLSSLITLGIFARHLLCKRNGDVDPDDTLLPKTEGNYIMSLKNPSYLPVYSEIFAFGNSKI